MTEHSPLPFFIVESDLGKLHIYDNDQYKVCTSNNELNANFILEACNNYDQLKSENAQLKEEIHILKRHWIEDDRDLNELAEENERLKEQNRVMREALKDIADSLDNELGDTNPDFGELTDNEIREEDPVFWSCQQANKALKRAKG